MHNPLKIFSHVRDLHKKLVARNETINTLRTQMGMLVRKQGDAANTAGGTIAEGAARIRLLVKDNERLATHNAELESQLATNRALFEALEEAQAQAKDTKVPHAPRSNWRKNAKMLARWNAERDPAPRLDRGRIERDAEGGW